MPTPNYAELVSKAEEAVAAVKDPELRRIAFQKVLDDLARNKYDQCFKQYTRSEEAIIH